MASLKSTAFGDREGDLAMYLTVAMLIVHDACIETNYKALFSHLSMHKANHRPSGQPLLGGGGGG